MLSDSKIFWKIVYLKTTLNHFGYFTMKIIFLDPLRSWGVEGKSQLEGASKFIAHLLTSYSLLIWGGWSETSCMHETRNDVLFCSQLNCSVCITKRAIQFHPFLRKSWFTGHTPLSPFVAFMFVPNFQRTKHNKHGLSMPTNNINLKTVSFIRFINFYRSEIQF